MISEDVGDVEAAAAENENAPHYSSQKHGAWTSARTMLAIMGELYRCEEKTRTSPNNHTNCIHIPWR